MSKYEQAIKLLEMLSSDEFQQFTSSEFDDAIYTAIEALEKQMQTCEDCLHAGPLQISHNTVFCFEHSCAMSSDNCCRDWIQRLGERR